MLYQSIALAVRAGVLILAQGGYVAAGLEPQAEPAAWGLQPAVYALWDATRQESPTAAPPPPEPQRAAG